MGCDAQLEKTQIRWENVRGGIVWRKYSGKIVREMPRGMF